MSKKHLDRRPHNIKQGDVWWYEENKGICIMIADDLLNIRERYISWRLLRGALARKDRKP